VVIGAFIQLVEMLIQRSCGRQAQPELVCMLKVIPDDGVRLAAAGVAVGEEVAGLPVQDAGEGWGYDGLEDGSVLVICGEDAGKRRLAFPGAGQFVRWRWGE
jgi:hypothetical protein